MARSWKIGFCTLSALVVVAGTSGIAKKVSGTSNVQAQALYEDKAAAIFAKSIGRQYAFQTQQVYQLIENLPKQTIAWHYAGSRNASPALINHHKQIHLIDTNFSNQNIPVTTTGSVKSDDNETDPLTNAIHALAAGTISILFAFSINLTVNQMFY